MDFGQEERSIWLGEASRSVWIASAPLDLSYKLYMKALGKSPSDTPEIPWDASGEFDLLPKMPTDYIVPRHMALFVIDDDVYYDPELTIMEKLQEAVFWEHTGSGSSESDGMAKRWDEAAILKILAIEPVGDTSLCNEIISQRCWYHLREAAVQD
ncbi:uncharacterized protein A1O5_03023 [Cladophialophora psammophila CBS 110553]|uniref:Uncharacterized protein n=1 Tax=Cladophialophora psammophila CBS 110553 TaxID=1182543 RepID=W9WZ75_9EURO|nr:uncharacterized protein A1O5_03023 [Cladophialophora psammophila CBS 110553]EXJ73263.1 hypothetical protein A1O5_03023 [Cladophialophora psammophila CBS 110553]